MKFLFFLGIHVYLSHIKHFYLQWIHTLALRRSYIAIITVRKFADLYLPVLFSQTLLVRKTGRIMLCTTCTPYCPVLQLTACVLVQHCCLLFSFQARRKVVMVRPYCSAKHTHIVLVHAPPPLPHA